jgi:hypothetical protein
MRTGTVDKTGLASALGWSRPRLDRRLKEDRAFPVLSSGDQAGGWRFDLEAVRRHLGVLDDAPAPVVDPAQLRDAVKPPPAPDPKAAVVQAEPFPRPPARRSAEHRGEASARQRKDEADAALKENKLRLENGELVVRAEMAQKLAEIFTALAHDLDALPEKIVKQCGLPEDAAPGLRDLIDLIRTEMVRRCEPLLADPDQ